MENIGIEWLALAFFVIGITFGSFFNVVASRTLYKESLAYPPSHCMNCNHNLSPLDLFPVLSYLFLKGKCRYCGVGISKVYPFIELLTGVSYALVVYRFGLTFESVIQIVFVTIMILATATDLREMIVPDRFIVVGLAFTLIGRIILNQELSYYLISSAISFGVLFAILILSKGKMGGADVKLYALIGLAVGWQSSIGSLFYASIVALLFYIVVYAFKGKVTRDMEIPFVPFITVGVLLSYFFNFFNF